MAQEQVTEEFERRKREREEAAEAKTAKNRAKRQKKKELRDTKGKSKGAADATGTREDGAPIKKRRLVDGGKQVVFRAPGEESDGSADDQDVPGPSPPALAEELLVDDVIPTEASAPKITIVDDD